MPRAARFRRDTAKALVKVAARKRGGRISHRSLNLLVAEIADGDRAFAAYVDAHDFKLLVGNVFGEMLREHQADPDSRLIFDDPAYAAKGVR